MLERLKLEVLSLIIKTTEQVPAKSKALKSKSNFEEKKKERKKFRLSLEVKP